MKHEIELPIQIRTPCPKRWEELVGDERRRFCSECALHVHNAAELTRKEARALVEEASGRVCMRVEYDASGLPVHRPTRMARLSRWALAAGAALLAACQGRTPVRDPGAPAPVQPPSKMGKVAATHVMGDVAEPPVVLGEAAVAPQPAPEPPR